MIDHYILDDNGEPVREPVDLIKWARMFDRPDRVVRREDVGDSAISTVFIGLDHAFGGGSPLIWETMVFGGKLDQEQDRCGGSRADALAMHNRMLERVRNSLPWWRKLWLQFLYWPRPW